MEMVEATCMRKVVTILLWRTIKEGEKEKKRREEAESHLGSSLVFGNHLRPSANGREVIPELSYCMHFLPMY